VLLKLQAAMKRSLDDEPEWLEKRAYNSEVNFLSVADAATAPSLSSKEKVFAAL
jgi:hypothetical protein